MRFSSTGRPTSVCVYFLLTDRHHPQPLKRRRRLDRTAIPVGDPSRSSQVRSTWKAIWWTSPQIGPSWHHPPLPRPARLPPPQPGRRPSPTLPPPSAGSTHRRAQTPRPTWPGSAPPTRARSRSPCPASRRWVSCSAPWSNCTHGWRATRALCVTCSWPRRVMLPPWSWRCNASLKWSAARSPSCSASGRRWPRARRCRR